MFKTKLFNLLMVTGVFSVSTTLSGCAVYRDAAVQGAADVGSVIGTVIGMPLGLVATALDESVDTASKAVRSPRPYQRTTTVAQVQPSAETTAQTMVATNTPIVVYTRNEEIHIPKVEPVSYYSAAPKASQAQAKPTVPQVAAEELSFWMKHPS